MREVVIFINLLFNQYIYSLHHILYSSKIRYKPYIYIYINYVQIFYYFLIIQDVKLINKIPLV